jgi:hypothetical protein
LLQDRNSLKHNERRWWATRLLLCSMFTAAGRRAGAAAQGAVDRSVSRRTPLTGTLWSQNRRVIPRIRVSPASRFRLRRRGTSPRAGLRRWTIAAAAAVIGAVTLGAQTPATDAAIPLAPGAKRQPQLELQAGGSEGGDTRAIRVYRWADTMEPMFKYYLRRLGGIRDAALDTASLASLRPGETTAISYHLAFHSFADQCADSAAGAAAGGRGPAACKAWRRAKDKQRALDGRLGLEPGLWIERATFSWFSRGTEGDLVRWRLELSDSGLSDDWQHYTPSTQLTVERVLLKRSAP